MNGWGWTLEFDLVHPRAWISTPMVQDYIKYTVPTENSNTVPIELGRNSVPKDPSRNIVTTEVYRNLLPVFSILKINHLKIVSVTNH